MRIAVYTITKNEAQFITRWAESAKDADIRIVLDTGSTDNTVGLAREAGCLVSETVISPWRFDVARNAALELVPDNIDYCIALDADEVLVPGWREELEKVQAGITRPRYKYVWSWNPDGSEGLVYSGDKIHTRTGYCWKHPVHEVITPIGLHETQQNVALEIHHHPDHTKSRAQYLPLLELAVEEDPDDDRNRFYLGREYVSTGQNDKAAEHLLRHLELSTWAPERSASMRYLSKVTDRREHWLMSACVEAPDRREPWVDLADYYYDVQNWPSCYAAATRALAIADKPLEYLCEASAWGAQPSDFASIAAWHIGAQRASVAHSEVAHALDLADQRLKDNLILLYRLMATSKVSVIIPTKSNITGLQNIVNKIQNCPQVDKIIIVGDGHVGHANAIHAVGYSDKIQHIKVEDSWAGIHTMWNTGISASSSDRHLLFLNDDVEIEADDIALMVGAMDSHHDLGLLCPNYDNRTIAQALQFVDTTCGGRYDGTGGLAGFSMLLNKSLSQWRFDEKMKWWYGDDDLLNWVTKTMHRRAAIFKFATCSNNSSWTINNDPPDDFEQAVNQDFELFCQKWLGEVVA
jgi:glycosyltransferase involved in cell wall biosynthesis